VQRDHHAHRAAEHVRVQEEAGDDLAEGEGREHHVDAARPKHGEGDEKPDQRGDERSSDDREPDGRSHRAA